MTQTVCIFVKRIDYEEDTVDHFVECETVGEGLAFESPRELIRSLQNTYTSINRGRIHKFTIENIVIG